MSLFRHVASAVVCLALVASARADQPPSPLDLMPDQGELLIEVPSPRQLVETLTTLDTLKQLEQLGVSKELLNSTQYRRFYQLVAYFEKELGAKWPELLDRLGGNGAALGIKFAPDPAPAILVLQGKDEKLMERFVDLAVKVIDQEVTRQEGEDKLVREKYEDIETYHIGKGFHAARVGAALLISNKPEALHLGLDLHLGKSKKNLAAVSSIADAHKLLPKEPLATLWINMEPVRETPEGKDFYKRPRDLTQTIAFGGLVDILSRTPFVAAGFYKQKDGLLLTVQMPRGREGMGPESMLHLAPEGQPASRPLLMPNGVIFTESFYLNVSRLWEDRKEFMGEKQAQDFEKFDKQSGQFLSGIRASKLMADLGPYHRIVIVNQPVAGYKSVPKTHIPAFAAVSEMRDAEAFSRSMSTILRGAALLFTASQAKMDLVEEKHGDVTLVGYRFIEGGQYKQDVGEIRYNFSPCFARAGNRFLVSSTLELGHEMIDLLQKETADKASNSTSALKVYGAGVADLLQVFEEQLMTQMILDQDLLPADARNQAREFIRIIRGMGVLSLQAEYRKNEFQYDYLLKTTK